MEDRMILIFHNIKTGERMDIEVPSDLTANELVLGLNEGLHLGIDESDIAQCYLKTVNPIMLLKGNRTLEEYGIYNGTEIVFDR